jgi:hypothetical protein
MWHRRRQRHMAIPQHETEDHPYSGVYDPHGEKNITGYEDSPAIGGGGSGFGHHRTPSELPAQNVDTYRNPGKPVPLYSEFEGSVPTHSSPAAPQRFEMGDSR